jgi:chromosome partitioning protein
MSGMRESCSVCNKEFEVQFRYQMEEKDGGFCFYCSQTCLDRNQRQGSTDGAVTCDACAKRFHVELVSQVLYVGGRRRYACAMECRAQLTAEARGVRLGELAAEPEQLRSAPVAPDGKLGTTVPVPVAVPSSPPSGARAPVGTAGTGSAPGVAQSVPVVGQAAGAPAAKQPAVAVPLRTAVKAAAPVSQGPKLIAIFNHKGGTGKTTTSVSVASGLALRGKKVLLIDTDAQGNVSVSLGVKSERSLYHVLVMGLNPKDAVSQVRENLDLIPSNETLAAAELYLAGRQNRDRVLASRLSAFTESYDYVVVDCSPSLSLLNQNALCLVDSVLVPVACDYLSLVGMRQVLKTVKNVNQLLHHPVRIWGVLPTFFDARAKICHEAIDTLKQHFGERCLKPIRQAIKIKEAPSQGQTIFEYASNSTAAEDYLSLVDKLIQSQSTGSATTTTQAPPKGGVAKSA